jgi:hypothetical protein
VSHFILAAAIMTGLGGCSLFHWSGYKPGRQPQDEAAPALTEIRASRERFERKKEERPRPQIPDESLKPVFYSDLGPDSVDVSHYPTQQKYNYAIYAQVCSQCHSLARSINAPLIGKAYWEFYMLGMRTRSRMTRGANITRDEAKAVLEFLLYDSKVRKTGENESSFNDMTDELKQRFDQILEKRLEQLQKSPQPRLLP